MKYRTVVLSYLAVILLKLIVCKKMEIKIGALLTSGRCCDFLSFEDKASAFNIAIDQLNADGVLNNETVSFE